MPNYKLEIHSSKLDSYSDCQLRGLAELVPQLFIDNGYEIRQTPQYITGNVGSAIHAGVADLHIQKQIITGLGSIHNLNLPQAMGVAKTELIRLITETPGVIYTKNFPDIDTIEAHITEYIVAYAEQVLPIRQAKLVEHGFDGQLADDVTYKTTLDLFTEDDILCDLKTGRIIQPAHYQMGMYLLLVKQLGYEPKGLILDYMTRERPATNSGAVFHNPIVYNHTDCMKMTKTLLTYLISDFRKFVLTKKFDHVMINPRSANCNIFCPLYSTSTCPGWKRP